MKKVLIPIDGSEFSDRAIEKAVSIAKSCGSEVYLLHVSGGDVSSLYDTNFAATAGMTMEGYFMEAEGQGKKLLEAAKAKVQEGAPDNKVETILLTGPGDVAIRIIGAAEELGADVIIMGSEGASSVTKGFMLGSVTNKVLYRTTTPVMVVK